MSYCNVIATAVQSPVLERADFQVLCITLTMDQTSHTLPMAQLIYLSSSSILLSDPSPAPHPHGPIGWVPVPSQHEAGHSGRGRRKEDEKKKRKKVINSCTTNTPCLHATLGHGYVAPNQPLTFGQGRPSPPGPAEKKHSPFTGRRLCHCASLLQRWSNHLALFICSMQEWLQLTETSFAEQWGVAAVV